MTGGARCDGMTSAEVDVRELLRQLTELEVRQQAKTLATRLRVTRGDVLAMWRQEHRAAAPKRREGGLTLRELEPWPGHVDGTDTLDELVKGIRRFVVIDEAALVAVVLWTLAAHALDAFGVFAILLISAACKGCGKSTLLDVLARLVPRPLLSAGSTAAALFRSAAQAPTVLVDEGDRYLHEDGRLGVFFCAGHRRGVPFRLCEGDDNRVVEYPSWCAKAIAQIGRPRDAALLDRCVLIDLRRKLAGEAAEPFSALDPYPELDELARRCARWAADSLDALREARPELPAGFANRVADNWTPLLKVAEVAGGTWLARARLAAAAIGSVEDEGLETLLLGDLRNLFNGEGLFEGRPPIQAVYTETLVALLVKLEERPWHRVRKGGRPLDGAWLGRTLGPFGIRADRITNGTCQKRGYRREQFEDAWARYIPPSLRSPGASAASGCQDGAPRAGSPGHPDMTDTLDERNEGVSEAPPDDGDLGGLF